MIGLNATTNWRVLRHHQQPAQPRVHQPETEIVTGAPSAEYSRATGGGGHVITCRDRTSFTAACGSTRRSGRRRRSGALGQSVALDLAHEICVRLRRDLSAVRSSRKRSTIPPLAPTFKHHQHRRHLAAPQQHNGRRSGASRRSRSKIVCPTGSTKVLSPAGPLQRRGLYTRVWERVNLWLDRQLNFQLNANNTLTPVHRRAHSQGPIRPSIGAAPEDVRPAGSYGSRHQYAACSRTNLRRPSAARIDVIAGYHMEGKLTPNAAVGGATTPTSATRTNGLADFRRTSIPARTPPAPAALQSLPGHQLRRRRLGHRRSDDDTSRRLSAAATYFASGGTHALKLGFNFEQHLQPFPRVHRRRLS